MSNDTIDIEQVMADMGHLHQEMNKDHIAVTENEKQGLIIFSRCNGLILELLLEKDCGPQVIELSLFYFFHELFVRNNDMDELDENHLDINLPAAIDLMTNVAHTIQDSGPDENAKKMEAMISILSDQIGHPQEQSKEKTATDAQEVNSTIMAFVNESINESVHPVLIQNALLYNWLRISIINAKAPESLFQIIERNWPQAVEMFDAFYLKHLENADQNTTVDSPSKASTAQPPFSYLDDEDKEKFQQYLGTDLEDLLVSGSRTSNRLKRYIEEAEFRKIRIILTALVRDFELPSVRWTFVLTLMLYAVSIEDNDASDGLNEIVKQELGLVSKHLMEEERSHYQNGLELVVNRWGEYLSDPNGFEL